MTTTMNAFFYIKVFAWIAIVALACLVFIDFWFPMLCGAVAVTLLGSLAATPRR